MLLPSRAASTVEAINKAGRPIVAADLPSGLSADTGRLLGAAVRAGVTVLLVEQNTEHALALAHRGFVLESGRVALSGTGSELLANAQVREAYLGL